MTFWHSGWSRQLHLSGCTESLCCVNYALSTYLRKTLCIENDSSVCWWKSAFHRLCTFYFDTWICLFCLTFMFYHSASNLSDTSSILAPTQQTQNQLGGMGIQWCRHMLVEIDGSEKRTMNLHHGPSLFLSRPYTPTVPSCSFVFGALFVYLRTRARSVPSPVLTCVLYPFNHPSTCLSVPISGHLDGGGKVIYSSFQDAASSSIYSTPTLFWSLHRYEKGVRGS